MTTPFARPSLTPRIPFTFTIKMKKLVYTFIATMVMLSGGCSTLKETISDDQATFEKLVGIWEGETLRKDGTLKKWIQTRTNDGEYRIEFKGYENGAFIGSSVEDGKWWIEDGHFHEINSELFKEPFIYKLTWLDEYCIQMQSISRDAAGDEYEGYTFSECKTL
jgi:hypothetical protein